jgi:5'-nucleotidase
MKHDPLHSAANTVLAAAAASARQRACTARPVFCRFAATLKSLLMRALAAALMAGAVQGSRAQQVAAPPGAPVDLTILAINDFHGNLKPPDGGIVIADAARGAKRVAAGGSDHLATLVKNLRASRRNTIFVAAGDLIGASPLLSALFRDEPTVESLSLMGLDVSAVGNHEFDKGKAELIRMQNGGCHPLDGCRGPHPFMGATFRYLSASTVDGGTGETLFPAYLVKDFDGVPVAFIGLTLKATPTMVTPSGVAGLEFRDEADTVNALVPQLEARGVEAIVVLIHEGGIPFGDYNECPGIAGPIVDIVKRFDPAVKVVVSGHTHRAYNCRIDGRLVTSADKYGTILTRIDVTLDRSTHRIVTAQADNVIVRSEEIAKDVEQTGLLAAYDRLAKPLADRKVGSVTATLTQQPSPAGETVLGDIIADAQLAATSAPETGGGAGGAVIAFTNPGGVRTEIGRGGGDVTFGELFACQPFSNSLVTLTLRGAQIKALLEQQWQQTLRILHVSRGFAYTWHASRPSGEHVSFNEITLDGKPLDPAAPYRVTVNSFLADGGDSFAVFKDGTDRRIGDFDVNALDRYFAAHSPLSPGPLDRIRRVD